jgi:Acyltransferase C-terminus
MNGVPPPSVHMHIRCFDVTRDVPLGNMNTTKPDVVGDKRTEEADIPQVEKDHFEEWVRDIWREKDILITKFLETGSFVDDSKTELDIPLKVRSAWEVLDAFCFVVPGIARWAKRRGLM